MRNGAFGHTAWLVFQGNVPRCSTKHVALAYEARCFSHKSMSILTQNHVPFDVILSRHNTFLTSLSGIALHNTLTTNAHSI